MIKHLLNTGDIVLTRSMATVNSRSLDYLLFQKTPFCPSTFFLSPFHISSRSSPLHMYLRTFQQAALPKGKFLSSFHGVGRYHVLCLANPMLVKYPPLGRQSLYSLQALMLSSVISSLLLFHPLLAQLVCSLHTYNAFAQFLFSTYTS